MGVVDLGRLDAGRPTVEALARLARASAPGLDRRCHVSFAYNGAFAILEAIRIRDAADTSVLSIEPMQDALQAFLPRIGFGGAGTGSPTTLELQQFGQGELTKSMHFVDRWAEKAKTLTAYDAEYVVTSVYEIFMNGLTHARSNVGVVSCGQFYPKTGTLSLSVVDLGIGIPASLAEARRCREEEVDSQRALVWALQRGNSSKRTSRGLGLATVHRMISRSAGALRIFSGRGVLLVDRDGVRTMPMSVHFPGTLVDIDVCVREVSFPQNEEGLVP